MIHSDNSFLPNTARRQFEMVKSAQKRLDWDGQTPHLSYYDQAPIIDSATARVVTWFQNNHGSINATSIKEFMEKTRGNSSQQNSA